MCVAYAMLRTAETEKQKERGRPYTRPHLYLSDIPRDSLNVSLSAYARTPYREPLNTNSAKTDDRPLESK